MTETLFSDLELSEGINRALEAMGFAVATPVQAQAIPPLRQGRDVLAKSQTGTGKTLAFAIPAIERINTDERTPTVQALVLCPTRELAMQAGDEVRRLTRYMPEIEVAEIYGGASIEKQCFRLRRANIVIGTPGRVMDHMRRKTLRLKNLKMLILDEADEMLNMGFKEDIETILQDVPEERQTVLFSATMPAAILALAKNYQDEPVIVEIDKNKVTLEGIDQSFVEVPHSQKLAALTTLLEYHRPNRGIIFCNTKTMVDEVTKVLTERGISCESLHSDIKQTQRTAVMNSFKHGKTTILAATDIAARGIDVNDVDFVINFDIPQNTEYYIHRIGRTGRAGKTGCSITISGGKRESVVIRRIASAIKSPIPQVPLPTPDQVDIARSSGLVEQIQTALDAESYPLLFTAAVNQLLEKGFTEHDITLAVMNMAFGERYSAPVPLIATLDADKRRDRNDRNGGRGYDRGGRSRSRDGGYASRGGQGRKYGGSGAGAGDRPYYKAGKKHSKKHVS